VEYYGLFNDSFPPILDGVTQTVVNYAYHLKGMELEPIVVTPKNPQNYPTDYKVLRYFSLPIKNRHPYRYGYPKLDFKIWRDLRHTPFKIIHSHSPFSAGRLAVYAARKQSVPLIGTFHSKYKTDLQHSFPHSPFIVNSIMKRIISFFNSCDEVWIPQAKVEETVREYGYNGKLTVVENGNDFAIDGDIETTKRNCRKRLGVHDNELSLLFVGQHIYEKGIDIIIDTLREIKDYIPFKMNFIGTGYALEDSKKKIIKYGLEERVHFHGCINSRQELRDFYAASDLFLFPSLYDNAPLVVREAAALETPSILIQGSTASEIIHKDKNGFLSTGTPHDYAAIIRHLYSNPDIIRKAGKDARSSLVRSWDDVMREVSLRYSDIIKSYKNRK
jgi:glycosyltransferase involved in cell wall biosynthesis